MRKLFSKLALTVSISLALAFTFSCSSDGNDDDGGGGSSVTGGADGGGNQFSQVYNAYWDDDDDEFHVGEAYEGSGIIEIVSSLYCSSNDGCEWNGLEAGSVTNGIVKLELPENIPNGYLENFLGSLNCSDSYGDIKTFGLAFVLTNSNKEYLGELSISYNDYSEEILYVYFLKAGKIKTTCKEEDYDDDFKIALNIDAKAGWNKLYKKFNYESETLELSTKNILTKEKEMKWILNRHGN